MCPFGEKYKFQIQLVSFGFYAYDRQLCEVSSRRYGPKGMKVTSNAIHGSHDNALPREIQCPYTKRSCPKSALSLKLKVSTGRSSHFNRLAHGIPCLALLVDDLLVVDSAPHCPYSYSDCGCVPFWQRSQRGFPSYREHLLVV